ncbi:ACP phosphodiesterase [Arcobacter arenosus]|uniref:ACP phosphodiesterase n=1 Tax=Arcobacter arenosus TaxID=2576037 RepID=UPI003BAB1543
MNWLAHLFLSEENIDFQVGNILADPLKAKPWSNSSYELQKGMRTHILIDSFSDKDIHFIQSKKRLKEKGILRGIVIDFTYDYLLTKNWDKFCNVTLKEFRNQFYTNSVENNYPSFPKQVLINIKNKKLLDFDTYENLEDSLRRVDMRVSSRLSKRDSALSYLPLIKDNIEKLEEDFLDFFPKLCEEVKKDLNSSKLNHWKI